MKKKINFFLGVQGEILYSRKVVERGSNYMKTG